MRIQSVFSLTQKKTENVPNNCLFCAVPCRRLSTTEDDELEEEGADLKRPKLDIDHLGYYKSSTFLEDEDPTVDKQLKAVFLLKNVLGIRKEKLCQFLGKFGGDNHPESWIKVCGSCGEAVKICFEVWREISKLERKLGEISKELRGHIWETREKRGDGEEEGAETVWRQVREDVLKGFDANAMARLEDDDDEEIKVAIEEIERDKGVEGLKDSENVATTSENSSEEVPKDLEVSSPLLVDLDDEEDEDEIVFERFDSTVTSQTEEDEFAEEEGTGIFINGDIFIDEVEEEDDSDFQNITFTPPELNQIEDNSSPLEKRSGRKQELHDRSLPSTSKSRSAASEITLYPPSTQNPQYTTHRDGRRTYYRCSHCCYQSTDFKRIPPHLELHKPFSGAISCFTCGCFLKADKVKFHNANHHPRAGFKKKQSSSTFYYKCEDCGALSSSLARLKVHHKLHLERGGKVCGECGWLCSSLVNHRAFWHPKEGGKMAEMRLRTAGRRIVTLPMNCYPAPRKMRPMNIHTYLAS